MNTPSPSAALQHDVTARDLEHDLYDSLHQPRSEHIQMSTQRGQQRHDADLRIVVRRAQHFDS